jgi:hypothetical protein
VKRDGGMRLMDACARPAGGAAAPADILASRLFDDAR